MLRSEGKSLQPDIAATAVVVEVVVVGDLDDILEVTGKDNPAFIATFNGIVMNGWFDCDEFATGATVPIRKSQGKIK